VTVGSLPSPLDGDIHGDIESSRLNGCSLQTRDISTQGWFGLHRVFWKALLALLATCR